jgi:pimeloyl-ACP methyl ester carboxylesterase
MTSRANFLDAAGAVTDPILLVYGADTPAKSKAEMQALAGLPNVRSVVLPAGKLAVHEEFAEETAAALRQFLHER